MKIKRLAGTVLVAGVALLIVAGLVWWVAGQAGMDQLETWLGRRIVGVLDAYLVPEIQFSSVDYQAPLTVVVNDLTLSAEGETVASVRGLHLTLASVPRIGEPIRFQKIDLVGPKLRLLQRSDGGFVGLLPFVHSDAIADPETVPENARLSQVLDLQHITIADGHVTYATMDDPDNAMVLPGIELDLDTATADGEPGWHRLAGTLARDPLFELTLDGRVNLDTLAAEMAQVALRCALTDDNRRALPPALQKLLVAHDVRGSLSIDAHGSFALRAIAATTGHAEVALADAHATVNGGQVAIPEVILTADAESGMLNFDGAATMAPGAATLDGSLQLRPPHKIFTKWDLKDVRIEQFLATDADKPPIAGNLATTGHAGAELAAWPDTIMGEGSLQLRDAELMRLPILARLLDVLAKSEKITGVSVKDRADVAFTLHPEHVAVTHAEAVSSVVALRATGSVFYDQRLDLHVNAGALEKLQSELGALGDLLATVSDRLVAYKVTGTLASPKVTIRPLRQGG